MIVDLSVPIEGNPSEPIRPQVDFEDHDRSAPLVAGIFGCEVGDLPDGKGWASETVTLITHAGTHVDARVSPEPALKYSPVSHFSSAPVHSSTMS